MRGAATAFLVTCLIGSAGCDSFRSKPPAPYEVVVKVEGDPGKPIEGAAILHNNAKVGVTAQDGSAMLKLRGDEGESLFFMVQCPEGHEAPSKPITVTLRRIADPTKHPEYTATCAPSMRTVVVAVRADNGPNLPVMYLGREVARTDESGAAHVMLTLRPAESFQLALKTTDEEAGALLRPQDPVATFVMKNQDDIVRFDQKFQVQRRVIRYTARPKGPTRL